MERDLIKNPIVIKVKQCNETIQYAEVELSKYLCLMQMAYNNECVKIASECTNSGKTDLELGLFSDFDISTGDLDDPELDDAIYIEVNGSKGVIAGSNSRSVLFAAYRFLEENGCKWIRPGKDGDYVPEKDIYSLSAHISEKASYRFRGSDACGIYSLENFIDTIEWFPKVGMNMVFSEFFIKQFNSWYGHQYYSLKKSEKRSDFEIEVYMEKVIKEIKKRDLIYHACGHGWTGKVLSLSDIECGKRKVKNISDEKKQYLAMVNGKREVSHRGVIHTDLCYGNPVVREKLVQSVANYTETHPEIDMLHFWLCDGMNINCECELCRDTRPSDFYVMILNAIDEELTKRNIKTRIVFLIYQVLIWPPLNGYIKNPDRFIMMFAPARRDYSFSYDIEADEPFTMPYKVNSYTYPSTIKQYISSYKEWRKLFSGEAFAFDYHMIRYHYFDPGYYGLTKVLAEDIRRLAALGINGCVSCQLLRACLPTGFPMYLHAKLLWNPWYNTDSLACEYFNGAFGHDGDKCIEYMSNLSEHFSTDYFYPQNFCPNASVPNNESNPGIIAKLSRIPDIIDEIRPIIEKNIYSKNETHALSWQYLFIHAEIALLLSHAFRARTEGRQKVAEQYWVKVVEYILINEDRIQRVFDPSWFYDAIDKIIEYPNPDSTYNTLIGGYL